MRFKVYIRYVESGEVPRKKEDLRRMICKKIELKSLNLQTCAAGKARINSILAHAGPETVSLNLG